MKVYNKLRGGGTIVEDVYERFHINKDRKLDEKTDYPLIIKCLRSHFVFYALSESELEYIVHKMYYCEQDDA